MVALTASAAAQTGAVQPAAVAVNTDLDGNRAYAESQAAIGRQIGDYRFTDRRGRTVRLSELLDRPLVISLIYTSCDHTCRSITSQLRQVAGVARDALGTASFRIATIGFDTRSDTPERMHAYAAEHNISDSSWVFLSADAETMGRFTEEIGFVYFPSPRGFDHLAQTTILDRDGRVYRQIYGDIFNPPSFVEPLKELVFGHPSDSRGLSVWIDKVRLFCTIYDPNSGRYKFDYSVFVAAITGLMSLGAMAVFIVLAWRGSRRGSSRAGT